MELVRKCMAKVLYVKVCAKFRNYASNLRRASKYVTLRSGVHFLCHSCSEWAVNFDCRLAEIKFGDATNGVA